jgi:uncharacterized cupredoxin-like copper-binding protein
MDRRVAYLALCIPLAIALPTAAESQTPVKVALTDMSAAMGMGPAGRGMMGYGMMGPGQGMMGYGWSSPGQGTPGQGQNGTWPMGPGMMMGMMAVRITQPSIKAGAVRFDVTNWSRSMLHEMLVVAVDNPQAPLPYDYGQAKVAEDQVKVLGDTGDLQPGASYTLDVTLTPGSYLLICNVPGHYAAGMVTPLTVTP